MGVCEADAFGGQPVDVWRANPGLGVVAVRVAVSEIVAEDDHNVRFLRRFGSGGDGRRERQERAAGQHDGFRIIASWGREQYAAWRKLVGVEPTRGAVSVARWF